jgi:hypothetical protein
MNFKMVTVAMVTKVQHFLKLDVNIDGYSKFSIMSIVAPNFAQIGGFLYFGFKMAARANRNGRNMMQHVLLPVNIHFH